MSSLPPKKLARVWPLDNSNMCQPELRGLPLVRHSQRVVLHVMLHAVCPWPRPRMSIGYDYGLQDAMEFRFVNWWF